jgi:hypothetical protein
MSNDSNDFVWSALILSLMITLAIIVTPIMLIGIPAYILYRLWKENPKRLERLSREETMLLYNHAIAGSAQLSDGEVETALAAHWPHDTPYALYVQLQALGKALFEVEGLALEIPPLPALCNTIEGARYRDMLARVGQARNDRIMTLSALNTISQSLATIADVAPPIDGDVLVEITQFAHPLNHAVQNIIAPFFQDNDYNHFKKLKARLDANLYKTHRVNPVFPRDYKGDDVVDMYRSGKSKNNR